MTDETIHHEETELAAFFDEKPISAARAKAEEKYRDAPADTIELMRKKCKTDLFFLAQILGYTKLSKRLHGDYAGWLQKYRGYQYKLSLLPRGHYKSTIDTITDSLQMALPNVAKIQTHPYQLGPDVKILLAHEVKDTATDFLFELTAAVTRKEPMLALFPEIIP